eukprot:TRINITY_DN9921_c0_g1_i1.p1 TRINITY_DN9921_c0_g1~~TRINITY_DN9921_c0_g1_i1.p1  ORF type:complete len:379 (+),score=90.78 TRINITY_DN9921_c0_g1_i1:71-1138(+)
MGVCFSVGNNKNAVEQADNNRRINRQLQEERMAARKEIKLLLIGAGESGKSTITKQIRNIIDGGFSQQELLGAKPIMINNIVSSMAALITEARELGLEISPENVELTKEVMDIPDEAIMETLSPNQVFAIRSLWEDGAIQECYQRSAEFQINDTSSYFLDKVESFLDSGYVPTVDDYLRCRAISKGLYEYVFEVDETQYRLVDMGGQRNERKKWLKYLNNVTAVLFCVAMSEYDLKLREDDSTNRMHESIKLFRQISNSDFFRDVPMIVLLNKKDLFLEKLGQADLKVCFPDYEGGVDHDVATNYMIEQFTGQCNKMKPMRVFTTCATDTENIAGVFNQIREYLLTIVSEPELAS